MATEPLYTFRDQDKLLEQNKQKTFGDALRDTGSLYKDSMATASPNDGAPKPPAGQPTGAFPGASSDPFAAAAKSLPDAPKTGGSFAQAIQSNPFRQQAVSGVMESISNAFKPAAPNPGDDLARNQVIKSQNEALRKVQEAASMGGRAATGQLAGDSVQYLEKKLLPERMNFEAAIRGQQYQDQRAREQAATQNLLSVEGLAQSGELEASRLGQQESQFARSLSQEAERMRQGESQFARSQAQQESQFARSLGSQEKIAFADLSIREKQLAQQASQLKTEDEFRRFALEGGWKQDEIARTWQAIENEKTRAAGREQFYAGLNLEQQKFAAADANAKRGLDLQASAQTMEKLGMDREEAYRYAALAQAKALAEKGYSIQEIDLALRKQGLQDENARYFAGLAHQSQESEKTRAFEAGESLLSRELQRYVADKGFSLDAKRLEQEMSQFTSAQEWEKSQFAQQLAEEDRQRLWQARENDVERKWRTGERLDVQDHEVRLEGLRNQNTQLNMKLEQTLGIQTADHMDKLQRARDEAAQAFESLMADKSMTHEQALEQSRQVFQQALAREGFDNQRILQANEIQAQMQENDKQRLNAELMQKAELALKYDMFREEMGIQREDLELRQAQVAQSMNLALKEFGLREQEFTSMMADKDVQDRLNSAAMLMEMSDDPAVTKMAAEQVFQTFLKKGYLTEEQYQAGLKSLTPEAPKPGETPSNAAAFRTFDQILENKGGFASDQAALDFGESMKAFAGKIKGLPMDGPLSDADRYLGGTIRGADYQAAADRLKSLGLPDADLRKMVETKKIGDSWTGTHREFNATPTFLVYTLYNSMLTDGLNEADAQEALRALVGEEKAKAALALEGRK